MNVTTKLISLGLGSALVLSAIAAPSAAQNQTTPTQTAPTQTAPNQTTTAPAASTYLPVQEYDEYMRLGYAAQQEEDFAEAANFFRAALYAVPNDREATIAYWNARNELQSPELSDKAALYETYMEAGYDATDAGDYNAALGQFQAALQLRPRDYYAAQAVRNVTTYLNRGVGASSPTDVAPTYNVYAGETPYDRYMRLGYAAAQREAFATAQTYFRSALYERTNDRQATIAYWNAVDGLRDGEFGTGSEQTEAVYDRYMRLGYDATQNGNYQRALKFFESAMAERPQDAYAIQAIRNVQAYLNPQPQ
ncbi:MAG: hypothetical protein AAF050_20670 [Cyanobacteria bacterium J06649_5]